MWNDQSLEELHHLATLKPVLGWSMAQEPRAEFVNVVVQDEFHHDVIVRVRDMCTPSSRRADWAP